MPLVQLPQAYMVATLLEPSALEPAPPGVSAPASSAPNQSAAARSSGAAAPAQRATRSRRRGTRARSDRPRSRRAKRNKRRTRATSAPRVGETQAGDSAPPPRGGHAARVAALQGEKDESHDTSLVDAFVLAASIANERDPAWHQLPLGAAGTLKLRLSWNSRGHVVEAETLSPPLPHLERVKERSLLSLRHGRHLRRSTGRAGSVTLLISAHLAQEASEQTLTSNPLAAVAHARRFPNSRRAGFAYFRFPSGRSVRLAIQRSD